MRGRGEEGGEGYEEREEAEDLEAGGEGGERQGGSRMGRCGRGYAGFPVPFVRWSISPRLRERVPTEGVDSSRTRWSK